MRRIKLASCEIFFDAATMPISFEKLLQPRLNGVQHGVGQKSQLGTLKSPLVRRWIMTLFRVKILMHRLTNGDLPEWKAHNLGRALIGLAPLAVSYSSNWPDFQIWILFLGIPIRLPSKTPLWLRSLLPKLTKGERKKIQRQPQLADSWTSHQSKSRA